MKGNLKGIPSNCQEHVPEEYKESMNESTKLFQPLTITIPGQPVPKARPRINRSGHAYIPAKTRAYVATVALFAIQAMQSTTPTENAVGVKISLYLKVPSSWSKKKKEKALKGEIKPKCRPDGDNYEKAIWDGLSGIVYKDDGQITDWSGKKRYSDNPRAVVEVWEIND